MNIQVTRQRFLNNQLIEPGASFVDPSFDLRFQIVVICDAVSPDKWHGEVRFGQHCLIRTAGEASDAAARAAARTAFDARVVALFGGEA
ncbi:hypothetical protein [Aeromicrobium sp. IC_218]|uniref:hypothetical protein n=1 Tax=Aeromicrobium sp. IC_218 TaxID=2545468 RepID=UPI00103E4007|nr:hypothetical protein [Aeromicrobium sp. IC_218]TCI98824.1 hypothetical protein E0W78_08705 [Aeromicrobium sp. IC_218]